MHKYINADVLLDSMGKAARELDTEGITDVDDMLEATEEAMRKCVYDMPAADVEPVERWISVDERLPEYEGSYLVCTAKSDAFIGHYYARSKSFTGGRGRITHWMDRPEPPKMDGGSE